MLDNRSDLESTVSVINLCKSICLKAIDDKMSEFPKEIAGLATLFIGEILRMPADVYLGKGYESDDVMYGNINFTQLFGDKAGQMLARFQLAQLREMSPEFDKFLKENPEYDQHNQSTDTKD